MGCFKAASVRPYSMLFKRSFTKEVSPWLSLSVKCPRLVAISVVAPTGSSLLPALRFAPSAVNPSCPTELARLAAPTMAVRSWPLRRSKAKAENAEEGLVPSSFSFLAAVPPDNDAIKPVPIRWFPNPPGNVLHAKLRNLPILSKICIDTVFRSCYHVPNNSERERRFYDDHDVRHNAISEVSLFVLHLIF